MGPLSAGTGVRTESAALVGQRWGRGDGSCVWMLLKPTYEHMGVVRASTGVQRSCTGEAEPLARILPGDGDDGT